MAFATGSRSYVSYVKEATYGVTPATPAMKFVRGTGSGLNMTKTTFQSAELRADRAIQDFRHGVRQTGGDLPVELSYGSYDDLLEGVMFGTWADNVLKNGVDLHSYTMERGFTDVDQYMVFTGVMLNQLQFSVAPDGIVTGTFTTIGKDQSVGTTPLDAAPEAVSSFAPFDSFTGDLLIGGVESKVVTALDLTINNGITPAFVIGENKAVRLIDGRCNITGNLTAFFEDAAMIDRFINETETSVQFTLGDGVRTHQWLLPRVKFGSADVQVQGEGGVTISMSYQALHDATEGCTAKLTRIAA
jgi:hypothetical protein